jgi:hypothetical protein
MRSRRIRIAEQEMTIKYIATNGRKADAMGRHDMRKTEV